LPNWDRRTGNLLSGRCPDPSNSPQIAGSPAGITANLDSSASFRKSYAHRRKDNLNPARMGSLALPSAGWQSVQ